MKWMMLLTLFFCLDAQAHDGPPYPILVDGKFSHQTLSVWADPDVGEGSFQFYLEGGSEQEQAEVEIEVWAVPKGIKTAEMIYSATHQKANELTAVVPFTHEGDWAITFYVKRNQQILERFVLEVEVTPPGPSKKEFLLYLLPFVIVAFIWLKAVFVRKRHNP